MAIFKPEAKPEIKYPRVMVSVKRHKSLAAEAKKKGMSIMALAEQKFKKAGK
ncbi:MAG TPA: hypothetical protein PKG74_03135 [Candidatus Colwellbacteria bacterium]|nr:hypothetical protein [Candidatus Colwellbacteria bacterium]